MYAGVVCRLHMCLVAKNSDGMVVAGAFPCMQMRVGLTLIFGQG